MPVILGPDGPSLGGFVCPATTVRAERWKLGQLAAGDTVRFVPVSLATARALEAEQAALLEDAGHAADRRLRSQTAARPVLRELDSRNGRRAAGLSPGRR